MSKKMNGRELKKENENTHVRACMHMHTIQVRRRTYTNMKKLDMIAIKLEAFLMTRFEFNIVKLQGLRYMYTKGFVHEPAGALRHRHTLHLRRANTDS